MNYVHLPVQVVILIDVAVRATQLVGKDSGGIVYFRDVPHFVIAVNSSGAVAVPHRLFQLELVVAVRVFVSHSIDGDLERQIAVVIP